MVPRRSRADEPTALAATVDAKPARPLGPTRHVAMGDGTTVLVDDEALARPTYATLIDGREVGRTDAEARYLRVSELGRGGMGRVDVEFDQVLGRMVARKAVVHPKHRSALVAEARIGAQLEHPAIVPVYDAISDEDGEPSYTMRVVRGRTLRQVLDDNHDTAKAHVGLTQLLGIVRQVCLAVDYAHSRGVIHRDIKPPNIVVGEFGEVYVLDWGVACVTADTDLEGAAALSRTPRVAGSPGYMAPEQRHGRNVSARSDVYALGVLLFEVLTGVHPARIARQRPPRGDDERLDVGPPSSIDVGREVPQAFDELVMACFSVAPENRPHSARHIADAIDAFLDKERARSEREHEADERAAEGARAQTRYRSLHAEGQGLATDVDRALVSLKPWDSVNAKAAAWDAEDRVRELQVQAARAFAEAETAFLRALGRVPDHPTARRGLADLYYRQFLTAEVADDRVDMERHLELARRYDDGTLALELSDQGQLSVESGGVEGRVILERYEPAGRLLKLRHPQQLGSAPTQPLRLDSGSYRVTVQAGDDRVHYPLLIRRACSHRVKLRLAARRAVPDDLVLIPGGPFITIPFGGGRNCEASLPDFAIARYPVTFRQYAEFLADLDEQEAERRTPRTGAEGPSLRKSAAGTWSLAERVVEPVGRRYVSADRELELPVQAITWYDARAYAAWRAARTGLHLRLPTALEWDKAMRGADGRSFPMGNHLDPAFAKIRRSRPEAAQPEPIGAFAFDESPYGVRDMAGGVGDWTTTAVDGKPLPALGDEDTEADVQRQVYYQGCHWGSQRGLPAMRWVLGIHYRSSGVGIRLALSLDPAQSSTLEVGPMER